MVASTALRAASSPSTRLTKTLINRAFSHLSETSDLAYRNKFFKDYMIADVKWTIAGGAHSMAGTRYNQEDHANISFNVLGKKLKSPICFKVRHIVMDADGTLDEDEGNGHWASVELVGTAEKISGGIYENEYVWLTKWHDGRIIEVRSYHDTHLAEVVLNE